MRAAEEFPGVFVVKESPHVFRAILAFMTAVIAWNLHQNWEEMTWFVRMFLSVFVVLLLVIFFKVAIDVTARFDRRAGRIDIARRGLFGARDETYKLDHFQRARVEESDEGDGSTFRLVLVFSHAMLAAMDPIARLRLEKKKQRGFHRLPINEVPLTDYLSSGGDGPKKAGETLNAWAGAAEA